MKPKHETLVYGLPAHVWEHLSLEDKLEVAAAARLRDWEEQWIENSRMFSVMLSTQPTQEYRA